MDKHFLLLVVLCTSFASVYSRNLTYGSYQVGPVCNPSDEIRSPKTADDVVSIVKEALRRKTTVKAFGARHSITDIICTEGIPISMHHFQTKRMNADNTATFGAGVVAWEVGPFLKEYGRALRTAPGYGNITVGGAVGTGAHGSTIKYHSSFSVQVVGLTIVDGLGNVRKISSKSDLQAFQIHLGLLGIVLDVTFQTVPFYKILAHNYIIEDDFLFDGRVLKYAKETDQLMIFWYPGLKQAVFANWTNVDPNTPGNAYINLLYGDTLVQEMQSVVTLEAVQQMAPADAAAAIISSQVGGIRGLVNDASKRASPFYTEDGTSLVNPAVGDWNRMVTSTCAAEGEVTCGWSHVTPDNPHEEDHQLNFIDQEFAMPLEDLPNIARRMQDILTKTPGAFPVGGIMFRFSGSTDALLSVSEGRDTCHMEIFAIKRRNEYEDPMAWLAAYQTFMQSLIFEFKARSHWGKSAMYYHSRDAIVLKVDPVARLKFVTKMTQYDPLGIFMNNFGRRLKYFQTKQDDDPKTTHCAIQDNCICKVNEDCADGQSCSTLEGYKYRVCV